MNDPISECDGLFPPFRPSRRGIVVSALGSGLALCLGAAKAAIATDTQGLIAGEIGIPVADGTLPGYRAAPGGG